MAVDKVALAGALLTRMKKDPEMTVRDAYAEELEHRVNGGYRAPWLPCPIPINKVATEKRANGSKHEFRLIFSDSFYVFF